MGNSRGGFKHFFNAGALSLVRNRQAVHRRADFRVLSGADHAAFGTDGRAAHAVATVRPGADDRWSDSGGARRTDARRCESHWREDAAREKAPGSELGSFFCVRLRHPVLVARTASGSAAREFAFGLGATSPQGCCYGAGHAGGAASESPSLAPRYAVTPWSGLNRPQRVRFQ